MKLVNYKDYNEMHGQQNITVLQSVSMPPINVIVSLRGHCGVSDYSSSFMVHRLRIPGKQMFTAESLDQHFRLSAL